MLTKIMILLGLMMPVVGFGGELQRVEIIRIVDANLFQSADGHLLRMAGVRAPSVSSADSFFARQIIQHLNEQFSARTLYFLSEGAQGGDTLKVHFFQKYPLLTLNLNERFLAEGYGRYSPLPGRSYNERYLQAQDSARGAGRGLWNPANLKPPMRKPGVDILLAGYAPDFNSNTDVGKSSLAYVEWRRYQGNNVLKVQLFLAQRIVSGEEGFNHKQIIGLVSYGYRGKYLGGGGGFTFINLYGGEGLPHFGWPIFSIQAGLLKKVYFAINFINLWLKSYGSFSLNYRFDYPLGHVRLERSFASDTAVYNLLLQAPVYHNALVNVRLFYNTRTHRVLPLFGVGFGSAL